MTTKKPDTFKRAALEPATVDLESRRGSVIFTTFADVQRRDMQGVYVERLDPRGANIARMKGGPVFLDHMQSTRSQIGAIESARIEGGRGLADIRLSSREEFAGHLRDIADGILNQISMEYAVREWVDGMNAQGMRTRTARRWEVTAISFVSLAADSGAKVRSGSPWTPKLKLKLPPGMTARLVKPNK